MSDKQLAIIGVVIIICVVVVASLFAHDSPMVAQIILTASVGGGFVVTLMRLGNNTEMTERIEKNTNGVIAARVAAAFREGYSRGKIDGAEDEINREAIRVKALADAAVALKNADQ